MKSDRNRGFTLVELMIVLAVVAVLLTVVAPAFTNLIANNRLLAEVYAMRATLNKARSTALAERVSVTVCRSDDGGSCSAAGEWNEGYIAFADETAAVTDPNDAVIFATRAIDTANISIVFSGGQAVRFDSRGYARGTFGTFVFCDNRPEASGLEVTPAGVVRTQEVDPNDVCP